MRRTVWQIALVLGLAVVIAAHTPVVSAQRGMVSGGVVWEDSQNYGFVHGELDLFPNVALGLTYSDATWAADGWIGDGHGIYGRIKWVSQGGKSTEAVQVGMWRSLPFSPVFDLKGWVGFEKETHSKLWLTANAEAHFHINPLTFVTAGVGTTLLKDDATTMSWLGVGVRF